MKTKGRGRAEIRTHFLVIVGFALAALALTYPAFFSPRTATPGNGYDSPIFVWNEWWVRYAFEHDRPLFWTDRIYAPEGVPLTWHTHTVLSGLIVLALSRVMGFLPAHNFLIFGSFVMSAYGTFLVARREPRVGVLPAFVAGIIFAFCPKKMVHLLEHPNLTSTEFLPLFVWAVLCAVSASKRRDAIKMAMVAALFFAANLYTEYTFAFFAALWFGLLLGIRLLERRWHPNREDWLGTTTLTIAAGAALLALPLLVVMTRDAAHGEKPGLHNWGAAVFAGDLKGFLTPSWLHPLLGRWGYGNTQMESATTLGIAPLLVGAVGMRKSWRDRHFLWIATFWVFFVLSLGSFLTWGGRDLGISLPYRLLTDLPIIRTARAPSRFIFVAALGLAVLVAIGLSRLAERVSAQRGRLVLVSSVLAIVLFEYTAAPFPTAKVPTSRVFRRLASEPGDTILLEVPLGWRDAFVHIGDEDASMSSAQTFHERRRMGGIVARADPRHVERLSRLPFVPRLIEAQSKRGAFSLVGDEDHRDACELLKQVPIGNVLVSRFWRYSGAQRYVVDAMPLDLMEEDGGYVAYRVVPERCADPAKTMPYLLAVTDPSVRLVSGWLPVEKGTPLSWSWTTGRAELVLRVPNAGSRVLRLYGEVHTGVAARRSRLRVVAEGTTIFDAVVDSANPFEIEGSLPESTGTEVRVTFETSELTGPGGVGYALKAVGWRPPGPTPL